MNRLLNPRAGRPAALAATVAILAAGLLAGCAASSSSSSSSSSEEEDAAAAAPDDCDGFLALGDAERQALFGDRTLPVYGADGLGEQSVVDIYAAACPAHAGESYLVSNIDFDASAPNCSVYLTLTPEQQATWSSTLLTEEYWGLPAAATTPETLAAGCADLGVENMVRLSNYLDDLPAHMAWSTETKLGYTWNSVLGVGAPVTGDDVVPLERSTFDSSTATTTELPSYLPGSACGFDPATDAVLPLALFIRSTTEGHVPPMSAGWSLTVADGAHPTVTAFLEANYSTGARCSEAADSATGARSSVVYESPSDAEIWSPSTFSVILKNWFSPRNPEGATGDLSALVLSNLDSVPSADDPFAAGTRAALTLDGRSVG